MASRQPWYTAIIVHEALCSKLKSLAHGQSEAHLQVALSRLAKKCSGKLEYEEFEKSYLDTRNYFMLKKENDMQNKIENVKKYTEFHIKNNRLNNSADYSADFSTRMEQRYPRSGKEYLNWYYGRFASKEWAKSMEVNRSVNYNQRKNQQGNI